MYVCVCVCGVYISVFFKSSFQHMFCGKDNALKLLLLNKKSKMLSQNLPNKGSLVNFSL